MTTEYFDLEAYTDLVDSFTREENLTASIYYRFRVLRDILRVQGLLTDGYSLHAGAEVEFMATYYDLDEMSIDLACSSVDTLSIHASTYRYGGGSDNFYLRIEFLTLSQEDQLEELTRQIKEGRDIATKYDLAARAREVERLERQLAAAKASL